MVAGPPHRIGISVGVGVRDGVKVAVTVAVGVEVAEAVGVTIGARKLFNAAQLTKVSRRTI